MERSEHGRDVDEQPKRLAARSNRVSRGRPRGRSVLTGFRTEISYDLHDKKCTACRKVTVIPCME